MTTQEKLDEAKEALHKLLIGQSVVEVGYEGERLKFTQTNIADLRAYIAQLEAELDPDGSRRRPFTVVY